MAWEMFLLRMYQKQVTISEETCTWPPYVTDYKCDRRWVSPESIRVLARWGFITRTRENRLVWDITTEGRVAANELLKQGLSLETIVVPWWKALLLRMYELDATIICLSDGPVRYTCGGKRVYAASVHALRTRGYIELFWESGGTIIYTLSVTGHIVGKGLKG